MEKEYYIVNKVRESLECNRNYSLPSEGMDIRESDYKKLLLIPGIMDELESTIKKQASEIEKLKYMNTELLESIKRK